MFATLKITTEILPIFIVPRKKCEGGSRLASGFFVSTCSRTIKPASASGANIRIPKPKLNPVPHKIRGRLDRKRPLFAVGSEEGHKVAFVLASVRHLDCTCRFQHAAFTKIHSSEMPRKELAQSG
jgi:hypothetical protein